MWSYDRIAGKEGERKLLGVSFERKKVEGYSLRDGEFQKTPCETGRNLRKRIDFAKINEAPPAPVARVGSDRLLAIRWAQGQRPIGILSIRVLCV